MGLSYCVEWGRDEEGRAESLLQWMDLSLIRIESAGL